MRRVPSSTRSGKPTRPSSPRPAQNGQTIADGSEFPLDQPWLRDALQPGGVSARLLQDLYLAEVLLSLDASADARDYFRSMIAPGSAETDTVRLSAAVVLSQILLIEGKHDEYAELVTETLAPTLLKLHRSLPTTSPANTLDLARHVPDLVGGLALLPLTSGTFLSGLSDARSKLVAERWEALRDQAKDDLERLAVNLVLEASYRQLGQTVRRSQAVERIKANSTLAAAGASVGNNLSGGITDEIIDALRTLVSGTALGTPARGRSAAPDSSQRVPGRSSDDR